MNEPFADAVIVAAGSSGRMGGADKLEAMLGPRPVLAWSVAAMARAVSVAQVIVVTRGERVDALRSASWLAGATERPVTIIVGGEQRTDSVRAGVEASEASVVLVHDGARPLASPALADAVAHAAARHGAAVPVVPVADSLKRSENGTLAGSVDRLGMVRAQTPQGARRELLVRSLAASSDRSFSDEAALLESQGITVATVPGEAHNLKITDPGDLQLVRDLVAARTAGGDGSGSPARVGFGQDSHSFGPDDGLWLGGLLISEAPRLHGHSDGDVVLHALATAVLSACGLGDLGRLFPSSEEATTGISSAVLLGEVVHRATDAGWRVASAQLAILGARPRLGGARMDEMAARVAELLGAPHQAVSVTASTGNLAGPEGAGRLISATALVTVVQR